MAASKKSQYYPSYPKKYKGNPNNIICRSNWERKFCQWCDNNENILEWGSEEIIIPYRSPLDGRIHRHFPDFYIKVRESNGSVKKYIIEVKPKKQCVEPKVQKKRTPTYIREVAEYAKNQAKWKAAKDYCEDRLLQFKILTEDNLGV